VNLIAVGLSLASSPVGHHAGHHAGGHPLWHYSLVALGAIAVFLVLIVRERLVSHPRGRTNASSI
jgi:hypothetical protein